MQESQVQYRTFRTLQDFMEHINHNYNKYEWFQIVAVPDYKEPITSRGENYRLFFILKND